MRAALLFQAWLAVAAYRLALWVLPWRVVSQVPRLSTVRTRASIEETSAAVQTASRFVPGASCLTQALALRALLARGGRASTLTLGVRNPVGALEAHAWLEAGGRIVLGDPGPVPFEQIHPPSR